MCHATPFVLTTSVIMFDALPSMALQAESKQAGHDMQQATDRAEGVQRDNGALKV